MARKKPLDEMRDNATHIEVGDDGILVVGERDPIRCPGGDTDMRLAPVVESRADMSEDADTVRSFIRGDMFETEVICLRSKAVAGFVCWAMGADAEATFVEPRSIRSRSSSTKHNYIPGAASESIMRVLQVSEQKMLPVS